jgi:drug/metabolite transporter (DMT)-like permease
MNPAAVLAALASAALFGISTPAAKALLGLLHPVILAGLFYCGAGIGIALLRTLTGPILNARAARQQPLGRQDYRWLAGAIALGGVAGPMSLMLGLARTPAATASLLLTVEGAATALLAWFVFHENLDRRIALGMACLVAGAAVVSWSGTPTTESLAGPLAIIGVQALGEQARQRGGGYVVAPRRDQMRFVLMEKPATVAVKTKLTEDLTHVVLSYGTPNLRVR